MDILCLIIKHPPRTEKGIVNYYDGLIIAYIDKIWYSKNMKNKLSVKKFWAGVIREYYGNVTKDMKIIGVAGEDERGIVAKMMFESLKKADMKAALLVGAEDFGLTRFNKFLSNAWKKGADYVVVSMSPKMVKKRLFEGIKMELLVVVGENGIKKAGEVMELKARKIVACSEDLEYENDFVGYGKGIGIRVRLGKVVEYKKGTEAELVIAGQKVVVATFLVGDKVGLAMAGVMAGATEMGIEVETVMEGISEVEE